MNTGVTEFCQFCQTLYNTYHIIIYLFIIMTVYIRICFYSLYDKTDKMAKADEPLKINGLECHEEIIAVMTEMTKVGERGYTIKFIPHEYQRIAIRHILDHPEEVPIEAWRVEIGKERRHNGTEEHEQI